MPVSRVCVHQPIMNWTVYTITVSVLILIFLATGYPVSPLFSNRWGNSHNSKSAAYYAWLLVHYVLGGLAISIALIGSVRNFVIEADVRQTIRVWAWSIATTAVWVMFGVHVVMPAPLEDDEKNLF